MDRLIATNSVTLSGADTAPVTGTPQYATDGNPSTNTPATIWPAYQYNTFQEELIAVILAAGITLDRTNLAQLSNGVQQLGRRNVVLAGTGSWTVPTGIYWVEAAVTGGGGGAPGGDATHCGSGGGAGGTAIKLCSVTPGQVIAYTVGAGGAGVSGDNPAGNGGTSSFGSFCSATGGTGGVAPSGSQSSGGSAGGTGSGGDINLNGGYGTDGYYWSSTAQSGGIGGTSFWGGGGRSAVAGNPTAAMNGQAPGSGAGGAYGNSTATTGGSGANGTIVLRY